MSLGLNIAGNVDYSPEFPLRDLVRQSRAWDLAGKPPPLTADGYPAYLPPGSAATLIVLGMPAGQSPVGDYVLLWDGTGNVNLSTGTLLYTAPGKKVYRVGPAGNVWLTMTATDPLDPVRNVKLYQPGQEYAPGLWSSDFLARWKGVKCLRFMDLMGTNNSTQSAWADRLTLKKMSWAGGVPLEALCDLANQAGTNPWFCIPHLASDDCTANMFRVVQSYLSPKLTPYFEPSNELWNNMFQQAQWVGTEAKIAGISVPQMIGSLATRFFKIGEGVFGSRPWVRVLAGQQANPWVVQTALDYLDTRDHIDAISCAYYMQLPIKPADAAAFLQNTTPAQAVAALRATLPAAQSQVAAHQAIATKYSKRFVAYEGGQHMVGVQGAENNDALTALLYAAQASQEMGDLYRDWYAGWQSNTSGDLLCHFSSTGWSKWGCWGLSPDVKTVTPKWTAFTSFLGGA